MTTITIQDDIALPQTTFKNLEELRNILNFISLQVTETNDSQSQKEYQKTKDIPLKEFNYLTDESL